MRDCHGHGADGPLLPGWAPTFSHVALADGGFEGVHASDSFDFLQVIRGHNSYLTRPTVSPTTNESAPPANSRSGCASHVVVIPAAPLADSDELPYPCILVAPSAPVLELQNARWLREGLCK